MQFVTLRPGMRLRCTARHFGRECGAHVIHRAGAGGAPRAGQLRDAHGLWLTGSVSSDGAGSQSKPLDHLHRKVWHGLLTWGRWFRDLSSCVGGSATSRASATGQTT